jgi:phosphatidylserine/phosphatidylglycerophosphate/cardiolipin synthase-like enzyme
MNKQPHILTAFNHLVSILFIHQGNNIMKKILFLLICFSIASAYSQIAGYSDFEIVESIPIETTLDNPDIRNAHEVWLEMINGAKKSLDIEQFYISNQAGEPLDDIIGMVVVAATRGVKVRIIVDARMYKTYPETVDSLKKLKNIAARLIDFGKFAGGIQHAKFFIVDGKQIFLGSQNFDWRALKHIHEIGIRIKHKNAVKIYQDIFNLDWKLAGKNDPDIIKSVLKTKKYSTPFRLLEGENDTLIFFPTESPKGLIPDSTLWDERNIIALIDGAAKEVVLQFLSYSPISRDKSSYDVLNDAFQRAAKRGVKVKMIVSDWEKGTRSVEYLKKLAQVPNIEVKFSSIPEWSGGYVSFARVEHCKIIAADGQKCWIGTSNAEKSYFYTSRNLGVIVKNKKIAGIIQRVFMKSWDGLYTELIKQDVEYQPRQHGEK